MKSIVMDFGGTAIKLATVDSGRIIATSSIPAYSNRGMLPRLPFVEREVKKLIGGEPLSSFGGIGISLCGIIDYSTLRMTSIHEKYEDAIGYDIVGWASATFGFPRERVFVDMDGYAALLGEMNYGCARGCTDVVMMIIGTGIGGAVSLDGRIFRGKHGQAALAGHMIVDLDGHECTCGGRGCVEANAAGWSIGLIAREMPGFGDSLLSKTDDVTFKYVVECARAGDGAAKALIDRCNSCWTSAALSLIHAFDPELLVLSGGVMNARDLIFDEVSEGIRSRAWTPWGRVGVAVAENPDFSVCLGMHSHVEGLAR